MFVAMLIRLDFFVLLLINLFYSTNHVFGMSKYEKFELK